ncbi:hypothetical protein JHK84_042467 [Glycine max]|nr:hypothetical protein JHK87_042161 [Glycine soja]KAG4949009.1 hypothetical protein JHK86_042248 [Glycine max]KAG4956491.1 hypothetical protein JHK85_042871 [Glycine max]KAG5116354.1 hypothetical protein JHK84_042467 [Glycine max]
MAVFQQCWRSSVANVLALTLLSSSQGQYESQVQIMGQRLQSSREQKEERELFIYVSPTS